MKNYIDKQILLINPKIVKDPVLVKCMEKLFEWANQAGLNGQKVSDLTIQDPDPLSFSYYYTVWCKMECREDENENNNKS